MYVCVCGVCAFIHAQCVCHTPLHPYVDLAIIMQTMEEALHQRGPLQSEGCDQEVEAHAAEAITLQEGH